MNATLRVNRCLADKSMDNIDHALGRPLDPLGETYRNHFMTDAVMREGSPHWRQTAQWRDGVCRYEVTDEGRRALADYLKAIGDRHRAYLVSFWDDRNRAWESAPVAATSRAKARYRAYLDYGPACSFRDFVVNSRVRLAESDHG